MIMREPVTHVWLEATPDTYGHSSSLVTEEEHL